MPLVVLSLEVARDAVDWVRMIVGASALRDAVTTVEQTVDASDDEHAHPYTVRIVVPDAAFRDAAAALDRELGSLRKAGMVGDLYLETMEQPPATVAGVDRVENRAGQRFVVLAPGAPAPRPDDLLLYMPPSAAFGTGVHPTTRACLVLIERHVTPGMDALDLGSGTGILSVALARRGADVLALDNDPVAVQATRKTVALNGLDGRVTVVAGSLGAGATLGHWMGGAGTVAVSGVADEQRFDLVVANVFARIHAALVGEYRRAVRPGGLLIIAGFTTEYADDLHEQLTEAGFRPADRVVDGEWLAAMYRSAADMTADAIPRSPAPDAG